MSKELLKTNPLSSRQSQSFEWAIGELLWKF